MSKGDLVLPPGVTGLFVAGEPPPMLDARRVATDVFAAARRAGVDCSSEPPPLMASYSVFRLREYGVTWWFLVNDVCPIAAFATGVLGLSPICLGTPSAAWLRSFDECELVRVLTQQSWEAAATPKQIERLGPADKKQIKYWKPDRLADIVFNVWD